MDYQDPRIAAFYDVANSWAEHFEFYVSRAGLQSCGVLDLGCGTGTLCCALAERGHCVTGVDRAAAMLAVARRKPYAERVEWVECRAQTYRSEQRFDLIAMTGHAFQNLLSDAETLAVLETMRRHLKKRGRVAFESRNPRIDWVGEWTARPRALSGGQIAETLKITAADGDFISFQTSYRVLDRTLRTSSTLRFSSREQLEAVITHAGLRVREVFGDWSAGPFAPARSREMIFIVELAE
jgi:ubiquinone/menaquinone biosynthesis C-methylase UbiE